MPLRWIVINYHQAEFITPEAAQTWDFHARLGTVESFSVSWKLGMRSAAEERQHPEIYITLPVLPETAVGIFSDSVSVVLTPKSLKSS